MNVRALFVVLLCVFSIGAMSQTSTDSEIRKKYNFDKDWKFSLATIDSERNELGFGTAKFGAFAKTGFGDGPTSKEFNDSKWRAVNLPHDWAVETPFSPLASETHGFHAAGNGISEANLGWYRKSFYFPNTDRNKRIFITFDGVFRNSMVWINGHFLGREESGYSGFTYDLTEYLNYSGKNIIAVRVDASLEEGWFYEGAGIYRHTWITETNPVHISEFGTFVKTESVSEKSAQLNIETSIDNETYEVGKNVKVLHEVYSPKGKLVAKTDDVIKFISDHDSANNMQKVAVATPELWSVESPSIYTLRSYVYLDERLVDTYVTKFGIRTFAIDPNNGFYLNGKHLKIQGTNNHQDHAGVGVAIPDDLYRYRVERLKAMGSNAYRASHNPTAPELLDVTDELGMLVLAENRLMGNQQYHLDHLKRLILRDRNHPSVIAWSIGNEEWKIEGNEIGENLTKFMQSYVKKLDPTRLVTQAISGGWGNGSSKAIEVMGFNYRDNGDTDKYHAQFPLRPSWGTEEGATFSTRGTYDEEAEKAHFPSYDKDPSEWGSSAEESWTHYGSRDYLAGAFIWTGFDYRGEATPYKWPAVSSQFGLMDVCGFPKDNYFYYQSWWSTKPVVHIFPHWNWPEKVGKTIPVWVYSNADEVELIQDGKSVGKKSVKRFSHVEWSVEYKPGKLEAIGYYKDGTRQRDVVETTGLANRINLLPNKKAVSADGQSLILVTVSATDKSGRAVPTADNDIEFEISGPAQIIGVGNGDPSSHEPDKFMDHWHRKLFNGLAQVIIQVDDQPGHITLVAKSEGLKGAAFTSISESTLKQLRL